MLKQVKEASAALYRKVAIQRRRALLREKRVHNYALASHGEQTSNWVVDCVSVQLDVPRNMGYDAGSDEMRGTATNLPRSQGKLTHVQTGRQWSFESNQTVGYQRTEEQIVSGKRKNKATNGARQDTLLSLGAYVAGVGAR